MKLEIRVGIDFGKLANEMPKLIDGYMDGAMVETVKVSKEYIKSGKVTPNILDITEKRRIRSGNPPQPPLYETGKLHDSLRATKDGINMKGYGEYQQFTRNTRHKNWKQRDFIIFEDAKDSMDNLLKSMRKALNLKSPLVLKV